MLKYSGIMKAPPKVLILYRSVGSGHKIAADGIEVGIKTLDKNIKIKKIDIMSKSEVKISSFVSKINYRSPVVGLIYDKLWKSQGAAKFAQNSMSLINKNFNPLERFLKNYSPDVVVCTQALCSITISSFKKELGLDTPHIAVLTDIGAHTYWPNYGIDLYCVPTFSIKLDLITRNIDRKNIKITGIPLRRQFIRSYPIKSRKAGPLKCLVLAGADQATPYSFVSSRLIRIISEAKKARVNTTVICGGDKEKKEKIAHEIATQKNGDRVKIRGYVKNMANLLSSHHLVITKPGGLICSEAVATYTPLILIGESYGQEKANAEYLINHGVAIELKSVRNLSKLLSELGKGKVLSEMSRRATKLSKKESSLSVAREVLHFIS